MKRYNSVYAGSYTKPHEMVEEKDGDYVLWEDVEALLNRLIVMLKAADLYIVEGTPKIDTNFSAIAKAEGGIHEDR